jgi:hypothetical protein
MKRFIFLLFAFVLPFISGCGTYQATTQVDDKAYVQIMGKPNAETIEIDGHSVGVLGDQLKSFYLNGRTATKIQIAKGTHRIKILRDGKVIVYRTFFVSSGNVFEVDLP